MEDCRQMFVDVHDQSHKAKHKKHDFNYELSPSGSESEVRASASTWFNSASPVV